MLPAAKSCQWHFKCQWIPINHVPQNPFNWRRKKVFRICRSTISLRPLKKWVGKGSYFWLWLFHFTGGRQILGRHGQHLFEGWSGGIIGGPWLMKLCFHTLRWTTGPRVWRPGCHYRHALLARWPKYCNCRGLGWCCMLNGWNDVEGLQRSWMHINKAWQNPIKIEEFETILYSILNFHYVNLVILDPSGHWMRRSLLLLNLTCPTRLAWVENGWRDICNSSRRDRDIASGCKWHQRKECLQ